MADGARVRRRVTAKEAAGEDPGRRRILVLGAVLGVIAGALIALFAIPPVFDRYFGVADVELGTAYRDGGLEVRVERVETVAAASGAPVVRISLKVVDRAASWCPASDRLLLEVAGGVKVGRLVAVSVPKCDNVAMSESVVLEFPAAGATPEVLHSEALDARFHLQPGDPRDR